MELASPDGLTLQCGRDGHSPEREPSRNGKGFPRRGAFVALSGKMQVPWLFDPNPGERLFESRLIERYRESTDGGR